MSQVEVLAEAQFGVLSRAQCLGLGMTSDAIRWRLRSNRWRRVHHGVYATHAGQLDWRARVSAALLYCGDGAVASHSTAARLHGLLDRDPDDIEVLIPPNRRVIPTSRVEVATCADVAGRTTRSGWPVLTTVEDTVLDLAARGDSDDAIAWLSKACQRRRTTTARLAEALDKRVRYRWRELLADALGDVAGGVESVLEYRYVRRGRQGLRSGSGRGSAAAISRLARQPQVLWSRLPGPATGSLKDCGCPDAHNPSPCRRFDACDGIHAPPRLRSDLWRTHPSGSLTAASVD